MQATTIDIDPEIIDSIEALCLQFEADPAPSEGEKCRLRGEMYPLLPRVGIRMPAVTTLSRCQVEYLQIQLGANPFLEGLAERVMCLFDVTPEGGDDDAASSDERRLDTHLNSFVAILQPILPLAALNPRAIRTPTRDGETILQKLQATYPDLLRELACCCHLRKPAPRMGEPYVARLRASGPDTPPTQDQVDAAFELLTIRRRAAFAWAVILGIRPHDRFTHDHALLYAETLRLPEAHQTAIVEALAQDMRMEGVLDVRSVADWGFLHEHPNGIRALMPTAASSQHKRWLGILASCIVQLGAILGQDLFQPPAAHIRSPRKAERS